MSKVWKDRYAEIVEDVFNDYELDRTPDPDRAACLLATAEEIRQGITAGLLDGPHPDAVPVLADAEPHATCRYCDAEIAQTAPGGWRHLTNAGAWLDDSHEAMPATADV